VTAVVLLVASLASLPFVSLRPETASLWTIESDLLGTIQISDGRGTIQSYEGQTDWSVDGTELQPINTEDGRAWMRLSEIVSKLPDDSGMALGMRHYLFNANTIGLYQVLQRGYETALYQFDPDAVEESAPKYLEWMTTAPVSQACLLLTASSRGGDFRPGINSDFMAEAARRADLLPIREIITPSSQKIIVWERPALTCKARVRPAD